VAIVVKNCIGFISVYCCPNPSLLPIWKQCYAFAVLADCLNALAVGAPLLPTFRIRSGVLPAFFCALIRAFFRAMLRYNPGGFMVKPSAGYGHPCGQQAFSLPLFLSAFSSLAFYTYILALLLPSYFTHSHPMRFCECLAAPHH